MRTITTWRLTIILLVLAATLMGFHAGAYGEEISATEKKNFLWQVRSDSNVVYVLGSVHILKESNYPLDAAIQKAYGQSQKLVFEIDLTKIDPHEAQTVLLTKGFYKIPDSLKDNVAHATYESALKIGQEYGFNEFTLNQFKPWSLAMTLMLMKFKQLGYDEEFGIDMHFLNRATNDQKEIIGLETFEYQIGVFEALSKETQESMLLNTIEEINKADELMNDMVIAWTAGDSSKVDELMNGELKAEFPELHQALLVKRNKEWLPKLEEFLKEDKTYLVVVGAGHLVGKEGVIELLRAKGYKIKQM